MKIGWILSASRNAAGNRIHGWNMHDCLLAKGIDSSIIYVSPKYGSELNLSDKEIQKIMTEKYDIIILVSFKNEGKLIKLIKLFQKHNIRIVYIKTDDIPLDLVEEADATIMVTEFAKREFPIRLQSKIKVIFDSYEHDGSIYKKHTKSKKIKLVFVSNNVYSSFPQIDELPEGVTLRIIGPPKNRVIKYSSEKKIFSDTPYEYEYKVWNLNTIEKDILDCDVAVIPYPDKNLRSNYIHRKSSNRLVLFMSYGIPTIVSPTNEYERLIENGKNGFIARSKEKWISYIKNLRDDPNLRKRIGLVARSSVIDKYSKEAQADEYLRIFKDLIEN